MSTETITNLHAQRQRLSLDALNGDRRALEQLARVEAAILELHRDTERAALAARERERRDAEERAKAEHQRRAELERRLHTLRVESVDVAHEVDAALDRAAEAVAKLSALGHEMYRTRLALKPSASPYKLPTLVHASLCWKLGGLLPDLPRPPHALRRNVADLLSGTTTTPEA